MRFAQCVQDLALGETKQQPASAYGEIMIEPGYLLNVHGGNDKKQVK